MIERYNPQDIKDIWSEDSKFSRFLEIEILVCEALASRGKIPLSAARVIRRKSKINVARIKKIEEKTHHDIVAFTLDLAKSIGKYSKYIHMGITSSDVLDTCMGWQIKDSGVILMKEMDKIIELAANNALKYKDVICPARTHGVYAEIYSFGLKFVKLYDELRTAKKMLGLSLEEASCGKVSGAVGTFAHIDPYVERFVCGKIGIKPARFSTQIVGREKIAYFLSSLAVLGGIMERFALEVRLLHRSETKEAEEPFAKGQKGSSAMPHKKNPVICERICGLSRLIRSNLQAALENIALWHERDISHSSVERVILPDSIAACVYILRKMREVIAGLAVNKNNMLRNTQSSKGSIFSQRILIALMNKGLERPRAYNLIQKISLSSFKKGTHLMEELLKDKEMLNLFNKKEIKNFFSTSYYLRNINKIYKKAGL